MRFDREYEAVKPGYTIKCPHCSAHLVVAKRDYRQPEDEASCDFHGVIGSRLEITLAAEHGDLEMARDELSNVSDPVNGNVNIAAQHLIYVQTEAMSNRAFKPLHGVTHCNQALVAITKAMGAPMGPLLNRQGQPLLANQMAEKLSKPRSGYQMVSEQQAQQIANRGGFVIATGEGLGHVESVSPDTGHYFPGHGPVIGMIGFEIGFMRLSKTFTASDQSRVKFYTPN